MLGALIDDVRRALRGAICPAELPVLHLLGVYRAFRPQHWLEWRFT
jgi:hypothetical protein